MFDSFFLSVYQYGHNPGQNATSQEIIDLLNDGEESNAHNNDSSCMIM